MFKRTAAEERISDEERMLALNVLPADMRDAYLSATSSHRRLLERLAQK